MAKTEQKRTGPSVAEQQPESKRSKVDTEMQTGSLQENLEGLIGLLESLDISPILSLLENHHGEAVVNAEVGERLVRLLQKSKSLSATLKDLQKRPRAALSLRDVALSKVEGEICPDLATMPLWHQMLSDTNRTLISALSELFGDRDAAESGHLEVMVDAFAEELDQLRQNDDLGPNKLELLIDSLKSSKNY